MFFPDNLLGNKETKPNTTKANIWNTKILKENKHKLEAKYVLPNISRMQTVKRDEKCRILSLVNLTFDFDLQTRPSEGPNTSLVWIWRKSVQRFRRYFIHKQKTQTDGAKNRTVRSSLHAVKKVAQLSHRDRAMHKLLRFAKLWSGIFEPPYWGA